MTDANGITLAKNNGSITSPGNLFSGGAGPALLIGLASVFTGEGLFGRCPEGGIFSGIFGGGRGCDNNGGRGYNSYNNYDSYDGRYSRQRESGNFFGDILMSTLAGFGLTKLLTALFPGLKSSQNELNTNPASDVNQKQFVYDPNATQKYLQLNNWKESNIIDGNCQNLEIASPKYREIMDAYHAGGSKDETKLAEAKELYTNDVLKLAKDSIDLFDKNRDGVLDKEEFLEKSLREQENEANMYNQNFDRQAAIDASERAFSRLSQDGKTVTDKDLAAMYAFEDVQSEGHESKCKGNISFLSHGAIETVLGKEDVYTNSKGETITNKIAKNIKESYNFLFPQTAE